MKHSHSLLTPSNSLALLFGILTAASAVFWVSELMAQNRTPTYTNHPAFQSVQSDSHAVSLALGYSTNTAQVVQPAISSRIQLVGIISGDPHGVALIRVDNGPTNPIASGEEVVGGWVLSKVKPTAIELQDQHDSTSNTAMISLNTPPTLGFSSP